MHLKTPMELVIHGGIGRPTRFQRINILILLVLIITLPNQLQLHPLAPLLPKHYIQAMSLSYIPPTRLYLELEKTIPSGDILMQLLDPPKAKQTLIAELGVGLGVMAPLKTSKALQLRPKLTKAQPQSKEAASTTLSSSFLPPRLKLFLGASSISQALSATLISVAKRNGSTNGVVCLSEPLLCRNNTKIYNLNKSGH